MRRLAQHARAPAFAALALAAVIGLALAACGGTAAARPAGATQAPAPASAAASASPAAAPAAPASITCASLDPDGAVAAVIADRTAQIQLEAEEGTGLPQSTKNAIAFGAWTDIGT